MATSSRIDFGPQIAVPWIVRLRYSMAFFQMFAILVANHFFKIGLPLAWMIPVPIIMLASNLWLAKLGASGPPNRKAKALFWMFVLDTFCLTALLVCSGGSNNPFNRLYFVYITVGAAILTRNETWFLGALSSVCLVVMLWVYHPIPELPMSSKFTSFTIVAFILVAIFAAKTSELLRAREESLLQAQEELAKKDRLASLATLAAGAAHELGTPLSTIAVVAKELEIAVKRANANSSIAEDCQVIRAEVERCGEILRRMSAHGAEPDGESLEEVEIENLIGSFLDEFSGSLRSRIHVSLETRLPSLTIPRDAVLQSLAALVMNALEASASDTSVEVEVTTADKCVRFIVKDHGHGFPPEVSSRIGEPFFTTKEPGKGMGLGTFLVMTLAERLGGRLVMDSSPQVGTTAILELPLTNLDPN